MDAPESRAVYILSGAVEYKGQWYARVEGTGCRGCAFQVPGSQRCVNARAVLMPATDDTMCHGSWQLKKNEESSSS